MKADSGSSIRLWAVSPRQVRVLAKRLSGESLEWCYFGTDLSRKGKVAGILTSAKSISISEELNKVAYDTKQPFLDWIAEIGSRQKDKLNWWASRVASKNPLETDFFLSVCYHRLFRSWMTRGRLLRSRIVVVEDVWLMSLLRRDFADVSEVAFLDSKSGVVLNSAFRLGRGLLVRFNFILVHAWGKLIAYLMIRRPRQNTEQANPMQSEILLYTWIEESCFALPEKLTDAYTGRLEEVLNKNGITVRRLTPVSIPTEYLGDLRPFAKNLLVTPQYFTFLEIIKSALCVFRIDGFHTLPRLAGTDYSPLLCGELLHEWRSAGYATHRLSYLAFRRLARHCGHGVKSLIYPFENQPSEKMLCIAFRDEAPHIRLIGYQHASIPPLWLCYFLGKDESNHVPLPDVIATNGQATLTQLEHAGFPAGKLVDGGAFRFEYLFDVKERTGLRARTRTGGYRILVAFPISWPHAMSLLGDLLEVFQTPFLGDKKEHRVAFILKFHPDLPLEKVGGSEEKLPEWFTVPPRPLSELLQDADLFLYSPPTGTWREAYLAGLPVVKYRGEFLDSDSTDTLSEDELPVCSRDTLRAKLYAILTEDAVSTMETRKSFLPKVFSPVNEKLWLELVSQEEAQTR